MTEASCLILWAAQGKARMFREMEENETLIKQELFYAELFYAEHPCGIYTERAHTSPLDKPVRSSDVTQGLFHRLILPDLDFMQPCRKRGVVVNGAAGLC